jgi:hypothetical protein
MGIIDTLLDLLAKNKEKPDYLKLKGLELEDSDPQVSFRITFPPGAAPGWQQTYPMFLGMANYPASGLRILNYLGKTVVKFGIDGTVHLTPVNRPTVVLGDSHTDVEEKSEFAVYVEPKNGDNGKLLLFGGNEPASQLDRFSVWAKEVSVGGDLVAHKRGDAAGDVTAEGEFRFGPVSHDLVPGRVFQKVVGVERARPLRNLTDGYVGIVEEVYCNDLPWAGAQDGLAFHLRVRDTNENARGQFILPIDLPDGAKLMKFEMEYGLVGIGSVMSGLRLVSASLFGRPFDPFAQSVEEPFVYAKVEANGKEMSEGGITACTQTKGVDIAYAAPAINNGQWSYAIIGTILNEVAKYEGERGACVFAYRISYRLAAVRPS